MDFSLASCPQPATGPLSCLTEPLPSAPASAQACPSSCLDGNPISLSPCFPPTVLLSVLHTGLNKLPEGNMTTAQTHGHLYTHTHTHTPLYLTSLSLPFHTYCLKAKAPGMSPVLSALSAWRTLLSLSTGAFCH